MPRLLIVEDDLRLRRTLAISLSARHYTVTEAGTGADALNALDSVAPDLVLLDLGLPDIDGLSVISEMRRTSKTPIIVVSARSSQSEKVDALEAGADDYLTKPFGLEELVARIRSALRRTQQHDRLPARHHPDVHPRFRRQSRHRRRPASQADPHRVAAGASPHPEAGRGCVIRANFCGKSGVRRSSSRATTCGCTWPTCAESLSQERIAPGTSSPCRGSGTASSRDLCAGTAGCSC